MQTKPAGQPIDLFVDTLKNAVMTVLGGSPALAVYKDNNLTQSTAGITLTVNFDGVVGVNQVHIDTTSDATFYANGSKFEAKFTAGDVDGVSVVGRTAGKFQLATAPATVSAIAAGILAAAALAPIDANVQEINDTELVGDGDATPWGPL